MSGNNPLIFFTGRLRPARVFRTCSAALRPYSCRGYRHGIAYPHRFRAFYDALFAVLGGLAAAAALAAVLRVLDSIVVGVLCILDVVIVVAVFHKFSFLKGR